MMPTIAIKAVDLTAEIAAQAVKLGATCNASPHLHECDHLLGHLVHRKGSLSNAVQHYFTDGKRDADQLMSLVRDLRVSPDASSLEFAAGYGRMSRHLGALNLTCCDIHREAVAFHERKLGSRVFMSSYAPEELAIPQKFDFIFVLSLFSHLPDDLFGRWLTTLTNSLNSGGFLMFTTHGEAALTTSNDIAAILDAEKGFGYVGTSEQADLDPKYYGTSVAKASYVIRQVYTHTAARIVSFSPGAWWNWQDQWVLRV